VYTSHDVKEKEDEGTPKKGKKHHQRGGHKERDRFVRPLRPKMRGGIEKARTKRSTDGYHRVPRKKNCEDSLGSEEIELINILKKMSGEGKV